MIIDAHVHMGRDLRLGMDADAERLLALADEAGIDRLCCTHLTALFYEMREGNRLLYEAMQRYPDRILGYATVTFGRHGRDAMEEVERCVLEWGMIGVKVYSSAEIPISDPSLRLVFDKAQQLRVPVLAHSDPCACEAVADDFPDLTLIMAHMGNTAIARGDWQRAIVAAERFPNIYLESCGSTVDLGFIEEAVERVGAERVLFGSDLPLFDPHVQLAKVTSADISDADKELILGGNFKRLFRLTA